jgi:hypothetical protein
MRATGYNVVRELSRAGKKQRSNRKLSVDSLVADKANDGQSNYIAPPTTQITSQKAKASQNNDIEPLLPITGPEARKIGLEYGELMTAESLSDEQEERIAEILELAINHPDVDFWVSHTANSQAMEAGLLSETAKEEYEDQKAMLREHLGEESLPPIRGRAAMSIKNQLDLSDLFKNKQMWETIRES